MLKYPNGRPYKKKENEQTLRTSAADTYGNRGMTLEADLNETNAYYLAQSIAVIHKKPTPVQIVRVDYPKRSAAVIKEAYFKQPSTTDYNGVYRGKYIDFEAKETRNRTSFPLQNFHEHQIEHMKQVLAHGAICFVILRFTTFDETYLLDAHHLLEYWERKRQGGRKSITKAEIERHGYLIPLGYHPRIDYIQIVDKLYF
ncbi:recombination protein U [Anoxybacillus mongoliensis]|uniref:Holliday junction resolvase RecU n=1 Tax=Anoxybacillus mongoliensis TaxID=452565 RepID=A0A7W8JEY9_9BACL|nr:Holliday junction resolvase RecU [Anoxybacillus mongoliensis]MBB5355842.1 recombination protein U [Anoxybacillus mongoliensis]MCX8001216.1 Holliday junction resolvase RecU [Anoxybacillus mongoliensis]